MFTIYLNRIPFKFKGWKDPFITHKIEFGSLMEKRLSEVCYQLFEDRWEFLIEHNKGKVPDRVITGIKLPTREDIFLFNLTWR